MFIAAVTHVRQELASLYTGEKGVCSVTLINIKKSINHLVLAAQDRNASNTPRHSE